MIVIVRIDLDRYELEEIERLVLDGVITLTEARESRAVRSLSAYKELMWVRSLQGDRRAG